jgi:hypothetical protein
MKFCMVNMNLEEGKEKRWKKNKRVRDFTGETMSYYNINFFLLYIFLICIFLISSFNIGLIMN